MIRYLRSLLFPVSMLYGIIVSIRNYLFDKKLLRIQSFDVPVVCIGNLSAGGTGKTPMIIHLIDTLGKSFKKPAVVTRGYGRKTKGSITVSDGQGQITSAGEGGDEPVLIARRNPDIVVIASEKRARGIQHAIQKFGCDAIFLDDAYQHRFVERDCDIVLINAREGKQGTQLLPRGYLREPLKNIRRADIVILTKGNKASKNHIEQEISNYFNDPVYRAEFKTEKLTLPDFETTKSFSELYGKKIAAFCGIANPQDFYNMLKEYEIDIGLFLSYPDHYSYSERDIYRIIKAAKNAGCETLLTTEKDLVRLRIDLFQGLELLAPRLTITVPDEFIENVRTFIDKGVSY